MLALVKYVIKIKDKGVNVGDELATLYAGELNPVAAKAQRKVPVPEGYVHLVFIQTNCCVYFKFMLSLKCTSISCLPGYSRSMLESKIYSLSFSSQQ